MKKKIVLFSFVMLIFCLGGCAFRNRGNTDIAKKELTMTEEEAELLLKIFPADYDVEKIESGELFSYQERMLLLYRASLDYLSEKYPDYHFDFVGGTPKNTWGSPYYTFQICETGSEDIYGIYIRLEEGAVTITDNFYGVVIRESYDSYVYHEFSGEIDSLVGIYSVFPSPKELDSLTMTEITDGSIYLSPETAVYLTGPVVSETEWEEMASQVEKIIIDRKIYGYYSIYYLPDIPGDISDGESCRSYMESNGCLYDYKFPNWKP